MPQSNNTEFDNELRKIMYKFAMQSVKSGTYMSDTGAEQAIKQLVSTHIIGNNASDRDLKVADSIKYPQLRFMNAIKDEQRKALGLHKGGEDEVE